MRGHRVQRPTGTVLVDGKADDAYGIGDVDPGKPLAPGAKRAAHEEAKGEHDERKRAASKAQHQAVAQDGAPHAQGFHRGGGGLPLDGGSPKKVVSGWRPFGDLPIGGRRIIVDARGLDDHAGLDPRRFHCLYHGAAGVDPALQNAAFARGRPVSQQALAGQVHDGVRAVGQVAPTLRRAGVPAFKTHARRQIPRAIGGTAEDDHLVLVALGEQVLDQRPADKPGAAGNDDAHRVRSFKYAHSSVADSLPQVDGKLNSQQRWEQEIFRRCAPHDDRFADSPVSNVIALEGGQATTPWSLAQTTASTRERTSSLRRMLPT